MSSCVLEEEAFRHCCHLLLQQSEQLRDGWSWESVQGSQEGYLRKTALRSVVINPSPVRDQGSELGPHTSCSSGPDEQPRKDEQSTESRLSSSVPLPPQSGLVASADADTIKGDVEDEDDGDEGVCTVCEGSSQVLQYEYHILYSCSYRTPVLYFRASTLEGRSLSLEEVWGSVHPNFRLQLQSSPLSTVTQQEHPLLGQPFFMLHPCKTEEFMRPVMQAAQDQQRPVNYVLTWLSVVGPVVGLDVPLSYCTQLHPAASHSTAGPG